MKKEKNFPLLRPYPFPQDLKKLRGTDPLFWGELRRLDIFTDWILKERKTRNRMRKIARAMRDIFGARDDDRGICRELNEATSLTQDFIRFLIDKIPTHFRGLLESEGEIAEERNFISLLEKRKRALSHDHEPIEEMREFEARRLIVLTLIIFDLSLHGKRLHLNGAPLQRITAYLEKKFFAPNSKRITIVAYHNRKDDFRVEHFCLCPDDQRPRETKKELIEKEYEFVCRTFFWNGKTFLVYFSCRNKTIFSHLLKMLRKDIRDPHSSALDWRGFKLVFFDDESYEAGLDKLRNEVFYLPGTTWKHEDGRFFKEKANPHSARGFNAKKFVTTVQGEPVEVIIESIKNHLNGTESLGEENHELYRLRQLIVSGFPLVFPTEIYNINWHDEEVQREIIEYNLRSFGKF